MKNALPISERVEIYEKSDYERFRLEHIRDLIPTLFKQDSRILEIGAGLGHFTQMLLERGCSVDIVEPDPERVGYLTEKFSGDHRVKIHAGLFPVCLNGMQESEPGAYDGIVVLEVIEHVPNPQDFLNAIHDRLRPEGTVLLSTPNRWSLESIVHLLKFLFLGRVFNAGDPTHLWLFSPTQLMRIFRKARFRVIHKEAYHFGCGDLGGGKIPGLPLYFRRFRFSRRWPFRLLGFNIIWAARRDS